MTNIQDKQERYDTYFMHKAKLAAAMSFAERLKVGAILVRDNRSLMDGWNGTITGQPNECELIDGTTSEFVLHAEQNLLMSCAKYGIPTAGATLYVTHSPCKTCSKLIAQAGISEVVYHINYRDTEGLDFLKACNIKVRKVN